MKYYSMIGTKLTNRYEILREIGRGGMGVVYLAYDPLLEREVAVKVTTPTLLTREAEERFKREARVIARMDHPVIVAAYDVGEHENSLFFVMPFIRGTNLRTFINDRSLQLGEILNIGIQVAEALEYSHSQGVIHRDIKPENILVSRDDSGGSTTRVRITDFGLAMVSSESRITQSGAFVGTIAYFSPEQVSGEPFDGRTDIYSLGTVLYECLVGETPFEGEIQSVLYRIAHEEPVSPRARGRGIDEELESMVMQCLAKDPASRWGHAKDLAEALSTYRSKLDEKDRVKTILESSQTVQYHRPALPAFVGRENEFSELQRRLNDSIAGECQFVVISGEVGVGKSRLLDELENLARARKVRVLHGRFVEQDRALPYQGFCEVIQESFRSKSGMSSSDPADFSDLVADLVSLFPVLSEIPEMKSTSISLSHPSDAIRSRRAEDRTYIFELLARALIRIARGKSLLLLFEDLHAADVSIEALQYIVRRLGPTPTMIVATFRSTEVDKRHPVIRLLSSFQGDRRFCLIHLEPFTHSEHRAFLEAMTKSSSLEDDLVTRIYEATEGNPYFARELVRSLLDSGGILKDGNNLWILSSEVGISSEILPATIQQTVEKRIERLPEDLRQILFTASILGRSFEFRDLEILAESAEHLEDTVDQLIGAGFIEEERESRGDRLAFSSGVVRDVLYGQLSRRKRRLLHRRYAEYLEKRHAGRLERAYPQLLHHYAQGDVAEKVIEYGLRLASKSLENFGAEEASRAARAVLDALEDEESANPVLEGEARILLAAACRMLGNTDASLKELERAIKVFVKEGQSRQVIQAIATAAETAWAARRAEETRQWVDRGLLATREREEIGSRIRFLSLGATIANLRGEYDRANQYLEEIERLQPPTQEWQEEIPKGGKLAVALLPAIEANYPSTFKLDEEYEIFANVFETLLTTDTQGNLVPWLCERWEPLEQGKSFLFTLRPNLRMQDGGILTSQDVKASFEKAIRLARQRPIPAFTAIRGVADYAEGRVDHVEGITALSETKLGIQLMEPLPIYPVFLTEPGTGIVREGEIGDRPTLYGTGPFKIRSMKPDLIILERNPDYWKGTPPFVDQIEFRASLNAAEIAAGLRSGKFDLARDLLPQDLEEVLRDRRLRAGLAEAPKKNIYFALFSQSSPIGGHAVIRQALCGILRTHDLVRRTLGRFAQPAEGLIPPGILGHDPGARRTPLLREQVDRLLEASELTLPLHLKASVHPILQDRYASLTRALFQAWSDIGVNISIETPTMASYLERNQKNEGIDLVLGRYIADYDDPDNFTYGLFHSGTGRFRHYYCSKELDQLIEEARVEGKENIREKLYHKIENILMESGILLPLFHDIDYRVANPKVRGLKLRSSPPYVNYAELGKAEEAEPTPSRKTEGGMIHVPIAGDLTTLEPSIVFLVGQIEVIPNIFETLTRETEGARIVPCLASSFQAEEGSKRFRFRLREDVRFHDGRRLTARDVRYSFERLLLNKESASRWFLEPIQGAKELLDGNAKALMGFKILSAFEFTIDLDQPVSFFPALVAYPSTAILPEGLDEFQGTWRDGCVGTGPFRVVRFEPSTRLELEANPYYWRQGYPKCDRLVFTFEVTPQEILAGFREGRFSVAWDLLPSDVEMLRRESDFAPRYGETPRLSTYYVVFNIHHGPLADENLRHHLIQAVDVDGLVRKRLGRLAIPAHTLIPPGLLGYSSARRIFPTQEPPANTQTLSNTELTSIINSVYEGPYAAVAADLLKSFRQHGFIIRNIGDTKSEYYRALASATADLVVTRWIGDYPDPDTFIHGLLHSERGIVGRVCGTPEIDSLIEKGRTESDPDIRNDIYREVEEIIARRALLLPLFHEQAYCFARPEVEGFYVLFSTRSILPYEKLWVRR